MSKLVRFLGSCLLCTCFLISFSANAQQTPAPNSDTTYQQLKNVALSEAVEVKDFTLKRDAGTFHLLSGTVCFLAPVAGKITGAVFVGEGRFTIDPPLATERVNLKLLTKDSEFVENFQQMVLRFTDATYDEIKKSSASATHSCDGGLLQDNLQTVRKRLRYNLSARILQDVLSPPETGLFVAFVHGKHYSDKMVFAIDPHGAPPFAEEVYREFAHALALAPEEVELMTYEDNKHGYWSSFHLTPEYKSGLATGSQKNGFYQIQHQELDASIEKNGFLNGKATTSLNSNVDGLRVIPFDLFQKLRVQSVTAADGSPLSFIQEDKSEDYQFSVILPKPLGLGEKFTVITKYGGKESVIRTGGDNYFPVARDNWYPNNSTGGLGEYTTYDMTFHIPKGLKMAATGNLVRESNEGGENVSVWKSAGPQTVAGFNFGRFRVQEAKLTKPEYLVQSLANEDPPDWVRDVQHVANDDMPRRGRTYQALR